MRRAYAHTLPWSSQQPHTHSVGLTTHPSSDHLLPATTPTTEHARGSYMRFVWVRFDVFCKMFLCESVGSWFKALACLLSKKRMAQASYRHARAARRAGSAM